jgi:hypothetical protein
LVPTGRTIHVALSAEGAVHPDAIPSLSEALAARLRDEGVRVTGEAGDAEVHVVLTGCREVPGVPAEAADGAFEPAAWDVRLEAHARLRRADGSTADLGAFAASGRERAAATGPADDLAQSSAFATAARSLAARIVAALLAAW